MNAKGPLLLGAAIAALTMAAAVLLAGEAWRAHARADTARDFQRLVGGLGLGPDLAGIRCWCGFDPRVDSTCSADYGPIPGGVRFCPQHACSIFFYPPLPVPQRRGETDEHALAP
jgi:hypothetical protein